MLPVYLKVFDEKLLFAQGTAGESQQIPLYTVFTGQSALYFCLIEGDERLVSWYRIVYPSARLEDDLFAEILVTCDCEQVSVALAGGSGALQRVGEALPEFVRMFKAGDYPGVLGIDRFCRDPGTFERACETQKLIFSDERDIQILCDNAEHRLTVKYRPQPPRPSAETRVQQAPEKASEPAAGHFMRSAGRFAAKVSIAVIGMAMLAIAALCVVIVFVLFTVAGWPCIQIGPPKVTCDLFAVAWQTALATR